MFTNKTKKRVAILLAGAIVLPGVVSESFVFAKAKCTVKKMTLEAGQKRTIKIKNKVKGAKYIFKSSKPLVAKVNAKGMVTAKKAGTALITASADGYQSMCRIVVKKPTFKVAKKMIKVKKGKKARIIVKVRPSTKVVFASANKKIAAVTKKGMLKGMKKGQTKIKVKCYGIMKTVIVIVK